MAISKNEILFMLSKNLEVFRPDLHQYFMCPTCKETIPLKEKGQISEAHIIPKSAGGNIKTYLCRKCNNLFGTKQDKWFGEIYRLKSTNNLTLLETKIKPKFFWFDDLKIHGDWEIDEGKNINIYIHKDRNPPLIKEKLISLSKSNPIITFPIPIIKKERMIEIGYLTAGYLMWFRELGYSWVFQKHLDPIRKQILCPDKEILKGKFIAFTNDSNCSSPWIGTTTIEGEMILVTGFPNCLVLLPPFDKPNFYSRFKNGFENKIGLNTNQLKFLSKPFYGPVVCVGYDKNLLIVPDIITQTGDVFHLFIQFSESSNKARILYPGGKRVIYKESEEQEAKVLKILYKFKL